MYNRVYVHAWTLRDIRYREETRFQSHFAELEMFTIFL